MGIGILLLGTFVAAAALGAACEDDSPGCHADRARDEPNIDANAFP
jgi:hypothetical protein